MAHENATPRPWELRGPTKVCGNLQRDQNNTADSVCVTVSGNDAALIVEAVNAYDTLRAENERLRKALEKIEDYVRRTNAPSPGLVIGICMDALSEAQP